MIPLNTHVKIVADDGKLTSFFIGQSGKVTGYKPNKFRKNGLIPIVQLENGKVVSGWGLWYEVMNPLTWKNIYPKLSTQQITELLTESFGKKEGKYHTLDEIPLYKLIQKTTSVTSFG